jgi:hypothetical protein
MTFNPDNYDISIRSVEPSYNHTLPRDTNRQETEHEAHLSSITVVVCLRADRGSGDYQKTFGAVFDVDHKFGSVTFRSVGDQHEHAHSFDPEKFWYVSHFAAEVVESWLDSVGLNYEPPHQSVTMWDDPPSPGVHTDMTVSASEVDR